MSLGAWVVGGGVFAVAIHLAVVAVHTFRLAVPTRTSPARTAALAAGGLAVAGQLVVTAVLLGQAPPFWLPPLLLGGALVLALTHRDQWRDARLGPVLRSAAWAAPIGMGLLITLAFA